MSDAAAVDVEYRVTVPLPIAAVVRVFKASGINRPADDLPRLERMFAAANLVVSAWRDGQYAGACMGTNDIVIFESAAHSDEGEASNLFARDAGDGLAAVLGNLEQTTGSHPS